MKIKYNAVSNVGCVRTNNEDMALVFGAFIRDDAQSSMIPMADKVRFSAIVADGMGGYGGGEIASEIATTSFDQFLTNLPEGLDDAELRKAVCEWFASAQNLIEARQQEPGLEQMGTTFTGIFSYENRFYMLNAGDSRVYRLRYQILRQLSTDHSERERLGDPSVPSNLIYNALGVCNSFVDVKNLSDEAPIVDGDTYIICSDGLHDMLSDEVIEAILNNGGSTRELVDAALEAGGKDNCTVISLRFSIPPVEETVEVEKEVNEPDPTEVVFDDTPEAPDETPTSAPMIAPPIFVQSEYEKALETSVHESTGSETETTETTTTEHPIDESDRLSVGLKVIKEGLGIIFGKGNKD